MKPLTNRQKLRALRARLAASAEPGFYPATPMQRLLTTAAQVARPSVQDADYTVDVQRPLFGPAVYLFGAFLALSLAAFATAHEAHALGWPLVEVGALLTLAGIGIGTTLLL